jgi:hypothetical protein
MFESTSENMLVKLDFLAQLHAKLVIKRFQYTKWDFSYFSNYFGPKEGIVSNGV